MKDERQYMDSARLCLWCAAAIAVMAAAALLAGCRTVRHVPVESVRTDSVLVKLYGKDSVYVHDSVFVNRRTIGDTVYVDKFVTRYKYSDRWRHDTVSVTRTDSVQVPYPVEKELGWWERTRLSAFPVLVVAVVVLVLAVVLAAGRQGKK